MIVLICSLLLGFSKAAHCKNSMAMAVSLTLGILVTSIVASADDLRPASQKPGGPAITLETDATTLSAGSALPIKIIVRNSGKNVRYFTNLEGGGGVYNVVAVSERTHSVVPDFGYIEGTEANGELGGTPIPAENEYVCPRTMFVRHSTSPGVYDVHLKAYNLIDSDTQERSAFESNAVRVVVK